MSLRSYAVPRLRAHAVVPRYPRALTLAAVLSTGCASGTPTPQAEGSATTQAFPEDDRVVIIPEACPGGRCADPYEPVYRKDEKQIRARVRHCAASETGHHGTLSIRVEIEADGTANQVHVTPTDDASKRVVDCVRQIVPTIPFQAIPNRSKRTATVEVSMDAHPPSTQPN